MRERITKDSQSNNYFFIRVILRVFTKPGTPFKFSGTTGEIAYVRVACVPMYAYFDPLFHTFIFRFYYRLNVQGHYLRKKL